LPVDDTTDWYERTAPLEYQSLYERCTKETDVEGLPDNAHELDRVTRRRLALALRNGWPPSAEEAYADLCDVVSKMTASLWKKRLDAEGGIGVREAMLWRLLRIGSAPYFVLGADVRGSMRLRVDTPWDWRQQFRLRAFDVVAQEGGQPRVSWFAFFENLASGTVGQVHGHVELRWSHGRFGQRPEAKVYLDVDHCNVPGYHSLGTEGAPL
ncbi:MAG TPA: hypothetical protein VEJ87_16055, partial [Acidimicrobiales bacterium]|nr:hypothetical protein [Acidimicrobiales bacterium]